MAVSAFYGDGDRVFPYMKRQCNRHSNTSFRRCDGTAFLRLATPYPYGRHYSIKTDDICQSKKTENQERSYSPPIGGVSALLCIIRENGKDRRRGRPPDVPHAAKTYTILRLWMNSSGSSRTPTPTYGINLTLTKLRHASLAALTIYVHYALRLPPRLTQFYLGNLSKAFYQVLVSACQADPAGLV